MLQYRLAKSICTLSCLIFFHVFTFALEQSFYTTSDTLKLEIKQAEKLFLDSNLQLLAMHYNVQSSKALVEQARKWDNPQISTAQNVYSPSEGFFKHATITDNSGNQTLHGEFYFEIDQLIKTAGKRRKQVDIAKTNVNLAEWQFNSTMRALRLSLMTDFYTIAQLEGNAELYKENLERLKTLITGMEAAYKSGNIARKEYLRIQSLIVSLQQNITDNNKSIEDAQSSLKTILRLRGNVYVKPVLPPEENLQAPEISIVNLLDSAKMHNTDYQTEIYNLQLQRQNLRLQKVMAVPDVTAGISRDYQGSYAPRLVELNLGIPLPAWDRNQGNIKSAQNLVKAEEANMQDVDLRLENEVMNAYKKLLQSLQLFSGANKQFYKDYYEIHKNEVDAFNKRLIGLLDFLDYYNDYSNTRLQELQHTLNLRLDKVSLNDVVGIDVVK